MSKSMRQVDLHVHSTRSDGTYSPTELVDYAMEKGLAAFALTDHDTVSGLDEAISYAAQLRSNGSIDVPEVIPGIEFSTEYQDSPSSRGQDVHIVGLYINHHAPAFAAQLQEFIDSRTTRNLKMCRLLQEAGIDITYEALLEAFPDAVITRAHYAKYMLIHGYVGSIREAFDRYVGDRCSCYVPREKVTPSQAVKLILEADVIPFLLTPSSTT